jgi:site-specific DNA-cytosine methylase
MNVLSLFDGMSCGQIALNRLGVNVENYYASEIDKYAIKVTQKNYPNTIQLGDIKDIKGEDLPKIDLLLAGSPCQGFSFAGKQLAFDDPRSALFFEFIRLLKEVKPKYFLLENVRMKKEYLDVITDLVGVEPILINSALVSAQNRQRYYWTNLPIASQPEDKGLVLKDILDPSATNFLSKTTAMRSRTQRNVKETTDKANALTATAYKGSQSNGVTVVKGDKLRLVINDDLVEIDKDSEIWRVLTPLECERLQTVPDNYTEGVSNTQRYKMLGNGWTVDVICHILKGVHNGSN